MPGDSPRPGNSTRPPAAKDEQSGPTAAPPGLRPLDDSAEVEPRKLHDLPPPLYAPLPEPLPAPIRYSLFELLVLVTLTAVMLASIRLVGAAIFAGIAGVLGFVMLVFISLAKPTRGIVHVAWWVVMVIYIVAAAAAVLNKDIE